MNALLLGTEVYLLKQDLGDLNSQQPLIICTTHAGPGAVEKPVASTASEGSPAHPFDWWRVESEDYKRYLTNLRGQGYPEKTIHDIITADVNEPFRARAKGQVYSINQFRP